MCNFTSQAYPLGVAMCDFCVSRAKLKCGVDSEWEEEWAEPKKERQKFNTKPGSLQKRIVWIFALETRSEHIFAEISFIWAMENECDMCVCAHTSVWIVYGSSKVRLEFLFSNGLYYVLLLLQKRRMHIIIYVLSTAGIKHFMVWWEQRPYDACILGKP